MFKAGFHPIIWWHREIRGHGQRWVKVTPPMFDIGARGYLVKCWCGTEWAL